MADICDEYGNPIQLTDEHGRPVQLTDQHGVPVHLTGVATTVDSSAHHVDQPKMHGGTHFAPTTAEPVMGSVVDTTDVTGGQPPCHPGVGGTEGGTEQLRRTGSSTSSSSSEDDGEGGRRKKKKGLMQKIKEKMPGHKNKEEEQVPEKVFTATTKVTVTTPAGPLEEPKPEFIRVEHHEEEHQKKGFLEKIKDKLPGHHSH